MIFVYILSQGHHILVIVLQNHMDLQWYIQLVPTIMYIFCTLLCFVVVGLIDPLGFHSHQNNRKIVSVPLMQP